MYKDSKQFVIYQQLYQFDYDQVAILLKMQKVGLQGTKKFEYDYYSYQQEEYLHYLMQYFIREVELQVVILSLNAYRMNLQAPNFTKIFFWQLCLHQMVQQFLTVTKHSVHALNYLRININFQATNLFSNEMDCHKNDSEVGSKPLHRQNLIFSHLMACLGIRTLANLQQLSLKVQSRVFLVLKYCAFTFFNLNETSQQPNYNYGSISLSYIYFLYVEFTKFCLQLLQGLIQFYLFILIKMLVSSQHIVSGATQKLLEKVQNRIKIIQKANENKSNYSSLKIFSTLGELTQQISKVPNNWNNIQQPLENFNLRLDSMMSVFNVQKRLQQIDQQYLQKQLIIKRQSSSLQNNPMYKKTPKNEIQSFKKLQNLNTKILNSKDNEMEVYKTDQQQFQDKIRGQKNLQQKQQKSKLLMTQKPQKKRMSAQQLKQKFSYDYESNRIKVKNISHNNLVMSGKSLLPAYSKMVVQKQILQKEEKPQPTFIYTQKITSNLKNKPKKAKEVFQQLFQQPINVQFSKIKSLTQYFECQSGVNLKFEGQFLKHIRTKTQMSKIQPIRLSRLDYLMMKKRNQSQTSGKYTYRSLGKQQSLSQRKEIQQKGNLITISTEKTSQKSKSRVEIANQKMHKYMLTTDQETNSCIQEQTKIPTQRKPIPIDFIDEFNLNYIKNAMNAQNKAQKHQQPIQLPIINNTKIPYLKVRQKLSNKKQFLQDMKKNFQQSLRQTKLHFKNQPNKAENYNKIAGQII